MAMPVMSGVANNLPVVGRLERFTDTPPELFRVSVRFDRIGPRLRPDSSSSWNVLYALGHIVGSRTLVAPCLVALLRRNAGSSARFAGRDAPTSPPGIGSGLRRLTAERTLT